MGFRYSRRVTLFPGVRLNFSARGISATLGVPGASVNIGRNGPTLNLGIPGTGLSHRQRLGGPHHGSATPDALPPSPAPALPEATELPATAIQSAPVEQVSSDGLEALKELIRKARADREVLQRAIPMTRSELEKAERRHKRAHAWPFRWFLKKKWPALQVAVEAKAAELADQEDRLAGSYVDADFALDEHTSAAYEKLVSAFSDLVSCGAIWDVTSSRAEDRYQTRSAAGTTVERKSVRFGTSGGVDDVLQTEARRLCLQNANGADLVLYPGFVLMQSGWSLALIDLREVTVEFSTCRFLERENIPHDSKVVGQAWAKSNKDGSPDRRFANNYQIPWVEYAELQLGSPKGLNEAYMLSSVEKAKAFAFAFSAYQAALRTFSSRTPAPVAAPPEAERPVASSALPTTPPQQFHMRSVEYLRTRSAVGFDDGREILEEFCNLLKADAESYNGQGHSPADWCRLVDGLTTAMPALREFARRSPGAKLANDVGLREVPKILRQVFAALEAGIAPTAEKDPEHRTLLEAVQKADAELRN